MLRKAYKGGRGGGAQRGGRKGGKGGGGGGKPTAATGSLSASTPAVVEMKGKNMGLGERSKTLILKMMHELKLQEEEDKVAAGGGGLPAGSVEQNERSSSSSSSTMKGVSVEEMEEALLHASIDDDDGNSSDDGDDLDGTFGKMANHLAGVVQDNDGAECSSSDKEEDEIESDGYEGTPASRSSVPDLSKRDELLMLKNLIKEERDAYVAEELAASEAAVAAAVATSAKGKGKDKDKKGAIKRNVRVNICSSTTNKKGKTDLARKLVVVDRKKDLQGLLAVAKSKLKIKKPKYVYFLDSGEPVQNTLLLDDDVVLLITDKDMNDAESPPAADAPPPSDPKAAGNPTSAPVDHVGALDAVKEAYRRRAVDRSDGRAALAERTPEEIGQECARLLADRQATVLSHEYAEMQRQRESLPAFAMRQTIVETVASSQVVVVEGETGSGKTTQVPQYILDDYISRGKGAECNIICTRKSFFSVMFDQSVLHV